MADEVTESIGFERDLREWNIPEEIMSILLKDRTTGKNIIWATEDYSSRGEGFGFHDQILLKQINNPNDPVIRPRVDKSKEERRNRIVKKAEVFTPAWICNKQNNLVDAAWFNLKNSPFNKECGTSWNTNTKKINFPKGHSWQEYVKAPRLEVSCGEAPYLVSRYDADLGLMIPVNERIGFLDRKLRIVTENTGTTDMQDWLYFTKRAVQSVYGFDWQGDNVVLARENILCTVIETYNLAFLNIGSSAIHIPIEYLKELAIIISWNIWQMDGVKGVVPMSCERNQAKKRTRQTMFDGTSEIITTQCPGCKRNDIYKHSGDYCMVMDWLSSPNPVPMRFVDLMGGNR